MKIAVFGKSGQVGRALRRYIDPQKTEAVFYDRSDCDLSSSPETIEQFMASIPQSDVIIIAAAYTGVERAETDQELVFAVNSRGPSAIARACQKRGIPLIYISTDYVFDGRSQSPYKPDDPTKPLNQYGRSKESGERGVAEVGARAAILRTSWIFDGTGANFLTTMLRLAGEKESIKVINDQIGRPTYAGHFAQAVLNVATDLAADKPHSTGIFHVTNSGSPVSWAGFAREILARTRSELGSAVELQDISSEEYKASAVRPAYSVLDISDFERCFDYTLPDWRDGLSIALDAWRNSRQKG